MNGRHASDCAVHSEPAYPAGPCDCHLSIESRLDEMIKHAYQGSTDAADEIRQELVERYKAMQPSDEPVAWGNLANWCLDSDRVLITDKTEAEKYHRDVYDLTALYTRPQPAAREPLTDEPVAWGIVASNTGKICQVELDAEEVAQHNQKYVIPLYTRPQPAAWVGLTDEEFKFICDNSKTPAVAINMTEAKLREKNGGGK